MDNYTRDYYRGRSFNFAGEWTINMHYYNDEYNTDFVTYKGALLVCKNSHFSERSYEPSLVYGDSDNPKIPTGVNSQYWSFVTGGTPGPKGGVLVPKYNEATGLLSWSLVDGDDVNIPEEAYIKGKDGITPRFRVNSSTGCWEVSYDNGVSYTSTNTKAQGEKGDPLTYNDLTSSQKAELQKPATEAAQKVEDLTNKAGLLLENLKGAAADATRAAGKAESAANSVDKAVANANAALATANSATEKAENATNKVNSAIKSIDTAVEKANNAASTANSAASNAEQWSHDVRETIGKCIMATDKADTAARKVFALLGLIDSSKKDVDAALKDANEALANAKEAEKTLDSIISNAKEATKEATEAASQLKDALKNVDDAVKSAEDFIESATKQIEDLKNSTEETINELTEKAKKKFRKFVEEATETINNLKEETEAALQEAQTKLEEISTKIENFVAEQTEELHKLQGDVEDAIDGARRATNAANEAALETLRHLAECREQCELTKKERKKAKKAAERAEAAAQSCEDFVTEYTPKLNDMLTAVDILVGEDVKKSVRTIAAEELAKQLIPENASESLNTLEEIAAWIQSHPDDASAMNAAIEQLKTDMKIGEKLIQDEVVRSTQKDNEHSEKLSNLENNLNEVITQGTTLADNTQNVINTLGMNEDGTFDTEKFKKSNFMSGDDADGEHIITVSQALLALDAKLHEVASDTTDWTSVLDQAIADLTALLQNDYNTKLDTKLDKSEVGKTVASLENGIIPVEQVPDYFDDVKGGYMDMREYTEVSPSGGTERNPNYMRFFARHEDGQYLDLIEGEKDKLYVDRELNTIYRWSGAEFVQLTAKLGEEEGSAYPGEKGKELESRIIELETKIAELETKLEKFETMIEDGDFVKYTPFGDNRKTIALNEGDTVSSLGINLGMVKTYDGLNYADGSGKMPVLEIGGTKGALVLNSCEDRVKVEVVEEGKRNQHPIATLDDFDEVTNSEINNIFEN